MGRKSVLHINALNINITLHFSNRHPNAESLQLDSYRDSVVPDSLKRLKSILSPYRFLLTMFLAGVQLLATGETWGATHVQQASNSDVGGASYTSFSATFSLPTTSGNAIMLGVTYGSLNPTITAMDSQGNTYVQAVKTYDSVHRQGCAILYATNITGAARNTVTVKFSQPVAYLAIGIHEYSGVAASSALDVTAGKLGIGNTPSSGPTATTTNGDLVFGCVAEDGTGFGDTFTAGTSLVKRVDLGNAAAYADGDGAQTLAGPFVANWTLTPASSWIATIAAFKTITSSSQIATAPILTSLSPMSGPVGATVTITGTNFGQTQGSSIISFSGTPSNATSWSPTSVVTTVPNSATTGNVTIKVNGLTSNGIGFSVAQLALVVSPGSTTLQPGQSQSFTASLQNDTQNSGVTWNLVGSGCSGISCGTLSNATTTSVTYNAPPTVPGSAAISLQATAVANVTKSASAAITLVAAPPISVEVNPASASVQESSSTVFTASVLNDSQNKGVNWSLSGTACSGASCGTLTNQTLLSVSYTAPASAPSIFTVTLTASSIADTTKTSSAHITVTQTSGNQSVPTFAENHVSGSSTQGNAISSYVLRLPNPTLPGNCIIVGFQYADTPGVTAFLSDDKGNTYSAPVRNTDSNQVVNLSYALNTAPGAQKITITFSGGSPAYVSALASEFYNVAPSNAIDGSSANSGAGGSVSAGSFTPTSSGDLIYQYAVQDSTSAPMIAWTQGANPWALLSADVLDGAAAQYQVQGSRTLITPTLGMAPAQNFNSVAISLKPASAGTAPPHGIRVIRVQHNSVQAYATTPVHLQFPSNGNLLVVSWIGVSGHDLVGITDGKNNAYTSTGPAFGYGLSGDNQIYYAAGAVTSTAMTGPDLSTAGSDISGSTAVLFDIRGAAASPYDTTAGRAIAFGTQNTSGNIAAASLSTTTANGLIISSIGVDSNTIVGVSPGDLLSTVPSPVSSPNPVEQNNGWSLLYNTASGPAVFIWTSQGGPVYDWASIAVAFMAAPN
jgi:hypothetical protein